MSSFWSDFKKFIFKGNILDLSVGVVIGGAFGKITASLVSDVIMPLISLLVGGLSVPDWKIVLKEAVLNADGSVATAETAICYGTFLQTILDFLIISFSIFLVLRAILKVRSKVSAEKQREAEEAAAKSKAEADKAAEEAKALQKKLDDEREEQMAILREIRDSLKK